ncbi:MAG: hypothetical protein V1772_01940 [Chloroflexota bacterium]
MPATDGHTDDAAALPQWAPRVPQAKIRRLYEDDAAGTHDPDLVLDVGWGLLARCESFIAAVEAARGRAPCPRCGAVIHHAARHGETLQCSCGWSLAWDAYFATIQGKQLSGAEPVLALFRDYAAAYPAARTDRERMLLIDRLLHGFHYYFRTGAPTRPVAINLIEGRLREVVAFLDRLTYGSGSTPGLAAHKAAWDADIAANGSWYLPRDGERGDVSSPTPDSA